jgi:hypothetical protein
VAISYGYTVPKIELWPMAGLAHLDGDFHKCPYHEFYIGVAGPFSNIIMGLLWWPVALAYPNDYTIFFLEINAIICGFNLLPIFPMDGGRMLRSTISSFMGNDWKRATVYATNASFFLALFLCPIIWMQWSPVAAVLIGFMALAGRAEGPALEHREKKKEIDDELDQLRAMAGEGALAKIRKELQDMGPEDLQKLDHHNLMQRIRVAVMEDKEQQEEVGIRLKAVEEKIESLKRSA